ncbi:tyrosine-type recombinase/integrase [Streptomyces lydicus]|uniref:tyrosine-type recombinase/integrase n=1 Tax=Streptomyces lydicus TaxID=47763 RepID=UPI0037F33C12
MDEANRLVKAWKAEREASGKSQRSAPSLTEQELSALVSVCSRRTPRDVRDAAILVLAWGTASQVSEIAALRVRDVEINELGVTVQRPTGLRAFAARTGHPVLDPAETVKAWLLLLAGRGLPDDGPLFCSLDREGRIQASDPLERQALRRMMVLRCREAGMDGRGFTFQSLRASSYGGRSEVGFDVSQLSEQGLWRPPVIGVRYPAREGRA